MKTKLVILFSLFIIISSCNRRMYREFTFKEKGVRELNIYFINDTLGVFQINYLCTKDTVNYEQKFIYHKISNNKISIKGIKKLNDKSFIYIPSIKLDNCIQSNEFSNMEEIPIIKEEIFFIYKRKLFWQKIEDDKIVSAYLFKGKH